MNDPFTSRKSSDASKAFEDNRRTSTEVTLNTS